MKAVFCLLILLASVNLARAGDFPGPPPFTNDSPLQSVRMVFIKLLPREPI